MDMTERRDNPRVAGELKVERVEFETVEDLAVCVSEQGHSAGATAFNTKKNARLDGHYPLPTHPARDISNLVGQRQVHA